jgi:serine protease Do
MRYGIIARSLFAATIVGLLVVDYASHPRDASPPDGSQPYKMASATPLLPEPASASSPSDLPNFRSIVAANGPAVVNISVTGLTKVGMHRPTPADPNEALAQMFQSFSRQMPPSETPTRGLGSGFILRPDGLVITNAHVVDGAAEITVKLADKREFRARLVGIDRISDLAVLKIDGKDLPVVKVGDPNRAGVGDWVLAIGSPFGFEHSVTAGIISAKGRSLPSDGYVPFIQTDVAVNPGNSGGPLFNLEGAVIGINSQIYSRSGGYQGLSFAIPIDVALKIEDQLARNGNVTRGRLGVSVQEVDQALADSFGLLNPTGALVDYVQTDGPAAEAGLLAGDIILAIGNHAIEDSTDLPLVVADLEPGQTTKMTVWRNRKRAELNVPVTRLEDPSDAPATDAELGKNALGLAVRALTVPESRQIGAPGGLLVEQSVGPAEGAGIRQGDIVLALNAHPVIEPGQLREFVNSADKNVALLVQRGPERLFVPLDLE